ncbi:MAG TPA: hypothetical protein VGD95_05940 [Micavibrio sp.]
MTERRICGKMVGQAGATTMTLKRLDFLNPLSLRYGVMAITFGVAMSFSAGAMAQTTPCDPQYMDALESRAYLEAQREIAMNENLILKPDSVLEYSCFDQIMGMVARAPGDRGNFSESNRWGEIPNHDAQSLDRAFDTVVTAALRNYIQNNFSHTFLGGRSTDDHTVSNVVGTAGNYNCTNMRTVWMAAKCMNFFDRPEDRFHDFQYLTSNDPRQLPTACPNNGVTAEWINRAFNNEADRYVLQSENPMDNTPYVRDPMTSHLDRINPVGTAPADSCAEPIPTGVVVYRRGGSPEYFVEKVCPNPGCYYVPSGSGTSDTPSDSGECQQ